MALIKCKECGKEISENANTCPHCGNPNKHDNDISIGRILSIIFGTILLVGSLYLYFSTMH